MSRWSANETEDTMKRVIVVAAVLLASAQSAYAAPVKKHVRVVNGRPCHEILITKDNAISYAWRIYSGTIPLPSVSRMQQCYTRVSPEAFARGSLQAAPSYEPGPSPPPAGPDTAGMNTSTNPTWPALQ